MKNKAKENPLNGYSEEELQKFYKELEDLQEMHMDITENSFTREYEGLLTNEGMGIVRAFYIVLLKFYQEHGIPIPDDIDLEIPNTYHADFESFSSVLEEKDFFDEELYSQTTGDGLDIIIDMLRLSYADGIGDFEAVNGAEGYGGYSLPSTVLADVYGEEYERILGMNIVSEDEEDESELDEDEVTDDNDSEELPAPLSIGSMFADAEEAMEYYINNIIDMRVIKSEKVGKVLEQIVIPSNIKKKDFLAAIPLLNHMMDALEAIETMQQYYLSDYCKSVVENGVWYCATISADVSECSRVATMFSRIPVLLGYQYFVQEVCDRVLDGRIKIPKVATPAKNEKTISP